HAIEALLAFVKGSKPVAQLRARHLVLEFFLAKHGREELVLIEQDLLVESHVRNTNGAVVPEGCIVPPDRDLKNGPVAVGVEAAVAVVVTDRVGGRKIGNPPGFEQRNQPSLMLSGDGNRPGNGQRQRAAHSNGPVEDGVDTAKKSSTKCGKTVL